MKDKKIKIYAFFLPQFHECSFNNEWWGKGFTEWENVKNALPMYEGHNQPRIPVDGYYNLQDKQTLINQFQKALDNGIDGFSIYHYWYEGKRPLGNIMDLLLGNPDINAKFSPCWANHSWTRSWTNRMGAFDVLIEQTYESCADDRAKHYSYLNCIFNDSRCIKVDGNPLFQIYRPENIPNLKEFIDDLRKYTFENGKNKIHISALITGWQYSWDYLNLFDSVTFFQPSLSLFSPVNIFSENLPKLQKNGFSLFVRALPDSLKKYLYRLQDIFFNKITFFDYDQVWRNLIAQFQRAQQSQFNVFPSAFVDFDNTPRYKRRAKIMIGFTPEKFGKYLSLLKKIYEAKKQDTEKVIFINAWNEWGEGMHLEADKRYGNDILLEVMKVKNNTSNKK
jgi:lipopolysaccharide biosynthesis protein